MNNISVKEIVYGLGADVCGIADITRFEKAPEGFHPENILANARSVIVIGKQFPKGTFISNSTVPYTLVRNQLIQFLDNVSLNLSYLLEENGYIAVPVPSSEPYEYWDEERRHGRGILSLKHSAQLAGIGSIGKNTLLVNEKFGNRLWLGAVITNLDLIPDPLSNKICPENCNVCIDACPQSALNGITIDQKRCREVSFTSTEGGGILIACNICRVECPFTQV